MMGVDYDRIPRELQEIPHWVTWNYETRGAGKPTKIPYCPLTGKYASVSKLDTWLPFGTVRLFEKCYSGLGFVLTQNDPFTFIDLDFTEAPEEIEFQKQIFEYFSTYSELSPSTKGLHLICKGSIPTGVRVGSVELYSDSRYMAMTGDVYRDAPIRECQTDLEGLFQHLNGKRAVITKPFDETERNTDLEVWNMAASASNGEKFSRLWNGDFATDYNGDQSRADFALIDIFGFYTNSKDQVKRLFRQSGLGQRPKANREKYIDDMVSRAFDNKVPDLDFSAIREQVSALQIKQTFVEVSLEDRLMMEMNAKPRTIDEGIFSVPPGLMGLMSKFIYDQSYKPVPEIAISGAIALMAGLCGRAYNVEATGLNVYLLLLAGTGRGKESIASGISKLLSSVQHLMPTLSDFIGPGHLASGQALLRAIQDSKTRSFVSIFGEFGITLKSMANAKFDNQIMLQKVFLDLFAKSGASDVLNMAVYADKTKNIPNIPNPSFSFVGESIPDRFYESIDANMITTGLLPRFTIVEYLGLRPLTNENHALAIPSKDLIEGLCNLATSVYSLLNGHIPRDVQFTASAKAKDRRLDEYTDKIINEKKRSDIDELWNRAHVKTRRLAALIAVGVNPYAPVIDDIAWDWAQNFVCNGVEKLCLRFEQGNIGNVSNEENQLRALRHHLRGYLLLTQAECKMQGVSMDFVSKKVILHSRLSSFASKQKCYIEDFYGASKTLKKVLQILIENGELIELNRMQMHAEFMTTSKGYKINLA